MYGDRFIGGQLAQARQDIAQENVMEKRLRDPGLASPTSEAGVPHALEQLQEAIHKMRAHLESLGVRLEPFLRPPTPEPPRGTEAAKSDAPSPLVDALRGLRFMVNGATDAIETLHRRLDA